ncbi:MAG: isocitrate/isopropylmalate dehydrogenase family protein [Clostridia bacterium]|nr:isocitrate/isopropylmalate dehydrogenase family protein [Clostridia bacterium]
MKDVVVLKGDGIGPEIIEATIKIIDTFDLPIKWHYKMAGALALEAKGDLIPEETIEAIKAYKVVLKGPMTTPIGKGFRSVNVQMRKLFDLSSNIRPASTKITLHKRYEPFDIVVFRENTEGLYGGKEYIREDGTAVAEKVVTVEKSRRIMKAACDYAVKNGMAKVTIGHKANILKVADGLFLEQTLEVGKAYPTLTLEPLIIDNLCAKVVSKPENFEVIVTTNLYGDILSDLLGGMVGSIGVLPSINIGEEIAFFEPVHGSAPDIAGQSLANPVGAILSGALMLKHIGYADEGNRLEEAVFELINKDSVMTMDIGGVIGTQAFADAMIDKLNALK